MLIENVGSRLTKALEAIYGTKNNRKISEKYNITQQSVGQLKKKKSINETISFICEKENINLNWIQSGNGSMFLESEKNSQTTTPSNLIELKYYENIVASAGAGAYNDEQAPTLMAFDQNFLRVHLGLTSYKNIHIITATGDSMEPTISAGELLFISPLENEGGYVKEGGIYIIKCEDSVLVKRVSKDNIDKTITLVSDNNIYPTKTITQDEFNNCQILGRVVGHFNGL